MQVVRPCDSCHLRRIVSKHTKENSLKVNTGGTLFIAGCPHPFHPKCCGSLHNMPMTLTCQFVPAAMSPTAQSCIFIVLQMVADSAR